MFGKMHHKIATRFLSTLPRLTHVDAHGKCAMVNVSHKQPKHRTARAVASVLFSSDAAYDAAFSSSRGSAKGPVFSVAELAGINAVKQTGFLVPLAHTLNVTHVQFSFDLIPSERRVSITCSAECVERTGIEVEAMMGASVAAVTVFDMCKAVDKAMVITDIQVLSKTGGKTDYSAHAQQVSEK
ncbi:Molybdenum cofactor synthesis protein 1 [Chytriomyces hyalinus]|nr:Molybdenum cofactor synthesis protein 1 [Chytriomyces hyalinus]